ncbi:MAG: archaeosortase/exosortase family protein [Kiritimatiellae bacterium]|nr:archaeosortase/exosortase family protein [Kiritimatiellia bacterium]
MSVRVALFAGAILLLALLFLRPLFSYARFALKHDLHSYTFLIPPVSLYLLWRRREKILSSLNWHIVPGLSLGLLAIVIIAFWTWSRQEWRGLKPSDAYSFDLLVLATLVIISFALCFGVVAVKRAAFPLLFFFLVVPLPEAVVQRMESALQYMSAEALSILLGLTPVPMMRQGMTFSLPGLTLVVAPECSGIRSTVVLFITTLVAGDLYLKTWGRRAVLSLAVVPLGAFRNAFRILTLAVLTMYVNPNTIKGPIHRQGGPLFFALSLVVILAMLVVFARGERIGGIDWGQTREGGRSCGGPSRDDKSRATGRRTGG